MSRLRVLHLIPTLGGGGAERQLALLSQAQCKEGLDVEIGYFRPGRYLSDLRESPVRMWQIRALGNYDPLALVRIVRLVRRRKPDVVQTWLTQMDVMGGIAAFVTNVPCVVSERSSAQAYPPSMKNSLREFVTRHARVIVANSEGGANYWRMALPGARVEVVRNVVVLEERRIRRSVDVDSLGLPPDAQIILSAGRLGREKNVGTLIEALDGVLRFRPRAAAIIFGDGPLREELEVRVHRCEMRDRIRMCGHTNELEAWMNRADVLVSLSLFEGSPNTVLEAMAIGCPLVVSDIPQHREILQEEEARFCDPVSALEVREAIEATLSDPAGSRARAAIARERIEGWSAGAAARRYASIYETVARRSELG